MDDIDESLNISGLSRPKGLPITNNNLDCNTNNNGVGTWSDEYNEKFTITEIQN